MFRVQYFQVVWGGLNLVLWFNLVIQASGLLRV